MVCLVRAALRCSRRFFVFPISLTHQKLISSESVALLARKGGCSYETKAQLASYSVSPAHVVKYLIVFDDNDHHHGHDYPLDEDVVFSLHEEEETPSVIRRLTGARRKRKESRDKNLDLKVLLVNHKSGMGKSLSYISRQWLTRSPRKLTLSCVINRNAPYYYDAGERLRRGASHLVRWKELDTVGKECNVLDGSLPIVECLHVFLSPVHASQPIQRRA